MSVRKLVLETAKFNVLTAHSTREALDLFQLFPNISAAIVVGSNTVNCELVARHIKTATDKVPVVFLAQMAGSVCRDADHRLPSHEPELLLELVRRLFGDPRNIDTPSSA